MTMKETINPAGQCLCGAVKISLADIKPEIGVCHCTMCRNWAGGPFLSLDAGDKIKIEGVEAVGVYNSSDWAERAFCKHCGTHLFYRLKQNNAHHVLAGLFDVDNRAALDHEIFIDQKPDYYNFAEDTTKLTAAEVMKKFSAGSEA
jgi:hypothetical protein